MKQRRFAHTDRPGFWLGFIDFFTAGLFFLICMPMGLQDEIDEILGKDSCVAVVYKDEPYIPKNA